VIARGARPIEPVNRAIFARDKSVGAGGDVNNDLSPSHKRSITCECISHRVRICELLFETLQKFQSLLAPHGGKVIKELFERMSGGYIVDNSLDRDARPGKDWRAAQNVRRARNDLSFNFRTHGVILTPDKHVPRYSTAIVLSR